MNTQSTTAEKWISLKDSLPLEGRVVHTKLDDVHGVRNEQQLIRNGKLWFFTDKSMYVYYTPTHWRYE